MGPPRDVVGRRQPQVEIMQTWVGKTTAGQRRARRRGAIGNTKTRLRGANPWSQKKNGVARLTVEKFDGPQHAEYTCPLKKRANSREGGLGPAKKEGGESEKVGEALS